MEFGVIKLFFKTHKYVAIGICAFLLLSVSAGVVLIIREVTKTQQTSSPLLPKTLSLKDLPLQQGDAKNSPSESAKDAPKSDTSQNSSNNTAKPNAKSPQASTPQANSGTPSQNGENPGPLKNCLNHPSVCGFPDDSNTGWQPTGVTLTPATLTGPGELAIVQDGTVIDGKDVEGCIRVAADNVVIKRSRVRCDSYFPIVQEDINVGMLVEDVEIDGLASEITNAGIGFNNYTMRRVNMHNISEGAHPSNNVLIEDSYIHDMTSCDICHSDTVQSDGAQNVIVRHNTIINQAFNKNAVLRFATESDISFNILIENNLLQGGNYIFQIRDQGFGFPADTVIRNNRMGRDWRFGPYDIVGGTITASNNFMDDTLEVIEPDQ